MIRTARLLSATYLLCGLVPALAQAQAPTGVAGTTPQSAPAASPGAPTAKPEPPATAQTRQVSVQAGTGVLLRLPQAAATVMSAEPAIARVQPASPTSLFLMGVSTGRTTVIATNDTGTAIVQYDVTITPGTASQPATAPGGGPAPTTAISSATAQAIQAAIAQTVQGASGVRVRGGHRAGLRG
jgi:pilus assembly protein CpaC